MPAFSQVSNDNEDEVYKIDARAGHNDFVPGQVLVKFKDANRVQINRTRGIVSSTNVTKLTDVLRKYGVNEMEQLLPQENPNRQLSKTRAYNGETIQEKDLSQLYQVKLSAEHVFEVKPMIEELNALDEVEFAEPNYKLYTLAESIVSSYDDNPMASEQWYLDNYGVKELWTKPIINTTRPVIAILDTGVDITHPDLVDNIWTKPGTENEHGYDFINETTDIRDNNLHGTHVAGIAAACNNETGIVGANPQALIMPITVLQSDGVGDVATIIKGIDYAISNGATVLNMSLGTYANSSALRQALEKAYQKAVLVAAAGNDNMRIHLALSGSCADPKHKCEYGKMFPAAYSFVLGVQAITSTGELASFSNHDNDGNTFSSELTATDPEGFNYELKAPGTNILSTIPGGTYKALNGTSMAAPLVAGAISALKMVKQYDTQEILWGDLLHTENIAQAYNLTNRPAELDLLRLQFRERKELTDETEEDYSGDGRIDVGETVSIYPVIRTTFGEASNIKLHLEMGDEYEDPSTVEIISDKENKVDFGWHLDAYGKAVSKNPVKLKVAEGLADGRHIKMKVVASCDESSIIFEKPFTMIIDNIVKIHGIISEDMTLTADHLYYVDGNLGVAEGVSLKIEPGTRIEFAENARLSSFGKLIAEGTPNNLIIFSRHIGEGSWAGILSYEERDTISYCRIEGFNWNHHYLLPPYMKDCMIISSRGSGYSIFDCIAGERITAMDSDDAPSSFSSLENLKFSNVVNIFDAKERAQNLPRYSEMKYLNYFNISAYDEGGDYAMAINTNTPLIDHSETPSYLGTAREDLIRPHIFEIDNAPNTFGQIDLENMPSKPYSEPHGIVWKVVVNGKDAQDEYDELDPLGVGKHKFEVYFNRPMNKAKAPQISFGVREPYTQNAVAEDCNWNDEGTIYTAYITITGKTKSDGVNRIYVYGAEDNEYFECPYEKTRFNVNIQSAGSQSTGFSGEAGLGRVELSWNELKTDINDVLGFNVYRYTTTPEDSVRVNDVTIDASETHFTDYDIKPGTTYYYKYKVQSTDLQEFQTSNVVAVTPQTAKLGDVTGNNEVDVFDIVYEVNYILGKKPKAFVKCAADVNSDNVIDVLDVQGIIKTILDPSAASRTRSEAAAPSAVYTIENGVLYVESPVALGGVQVQVNVPEKTNITTLDDLKGFEQAGSWLSKNDYLFMAYNMKGKTLIPGKHALLRIGDGQVTSIRLGDADAKSITVIAGEGTTAIDNMATAVKKQSGIYNLKGQKVAGSAEEFRNLPKGIYIIDGNKVLK